ncbi:GNAT family N-acetyltransferase, partial [Ralstonia pseudosolanacearum]|uniref:GNAT family N-acetyltransferase n=2 Tax=Ralstonia pseudosolanacearum TaxID=1310165 RepID=UPI003AAAF581
KQPSSMLRESVSWTYSLPTNEILPLTMEPIRLSPANAPEYRNLMLEAYSLHPDAFTSSAAERESLPLSWWEQRLSEGEDANEVVFGCVFENQLAGVVGLAFERREKTRHKATLFGMYVSAGFRHLGLGGQLMNCALAHAKERHGIRVIQLTVSEGNRAAQTLYERSGFIQFGCEPYAIAVGNGFVSKIHMWRDLSGARLEAS